MTRDHMRSATAYLIDGPRTRLGFRYIKQLPTTMDAEAQKAKFAIHQACRDGQSMLTRSR
jgi:hypothetical protein